MALVKMVRVRIQENILKETKAEMQKQRTQRSKIEKDNIKSRSRCENICYETFCT